MEWTIKITGIDSTAPSPSLILSGPIGHWQPSDEDLTGVQKGDTIHWEIESGSGVALITAIQNDPTKGVDIFIHNPVQDQGTLVWSGTVGSTLSVPCEETYTINFTPIGSNEVHSFDPKIQVDS